MQLTVIQTLPALNVGGVERGTLEIAAALVKKGHRSIVVSAGGRLVQQLVDQGSEHIALPIGEKSLFTLRHIYKLRDILSAENASILHARSRFPAWISYLAWKSMAPDLRPHFVTTVHGPYTVNSYSKIMTKGERVIAISEYIRDYILKNYPQTDEKKIQVIHRGVSPQEYPYGYQPDNQWLLDWNKQFPQLSGKFIITLPARVTRWKGHEDFLEIIRQALARKLPIHALVAGGPHNGKESFFHAIQDTAQKISIADHITFLGHRDDLKNILAVSDVVFSLAKEPEAFGRTALEGLSIGKPVIAYDHGGAAEVLREMFPEGRITPHDINAACDRLERFFNSTPLVKQHNPFTLDRMQTDTINLYESLLDSP